MKGRRSAWPCLSFLFAPNRVLERDIAGISTKVWLFGEAIPDKGCPRKEERVVEGGSYDQSVKSGTETDENSLLLPCPGYFSRG